MLYSSTMMSKPFYDPCQHGFLGLAVSSVRVHLGEPEKNVEEIINVSKRVSQEGAQLLLTPELSLCGYSLDDLFHQEVLLHACKRALCSLMAATKDLPTIIVVGLPIASDTGLYNVAAVILGGRCLGMVPKRYIPNYGEFYEKRHFSSGKNLAASCTLDGERVPLADRLLFRLPEPWDTCFAIDICEDGWVPAPPGMFACLAGASMVLNPSASNVTINKAPLREQFMQQMSYRGRCVLAYVAAGYGESTTDLAWDGQGLIYECGEKKGELERYVLESNSVVSDVDLLHAKRERRLLNVYQDNAHDMAQSYQEVFCPLEPVQGPRKLHRQIAKFPYIPDDVQERDRICQEIYEIQVQGLMRRVEASGQKRLVLGLSGGIDSAHALMVSCEVIKRLKYPLDYVMPWYLQAPASSAASRKRAMSLCRALGVTCRHISITKTMNEMLRKIEHPTTKKGQEQAFDVTYENVQAGLRSDYLFRLANQQKGLVVGTGDLSELALGWCTFGIGDHMAHYNVNASLAKTLIQYVMTWVGMHRATSSKLSKAVKDIIEAEIMPELIPGRIRGSEEVLGPYSINDFILYHTLRNGFPPEKVAFLAQQVWSNEGIGTIFERLENFYQRFFTNQFKRSTIPNAPKTSSGGSLSPRGDWRAPSDLQAGVWLKRVKTLRQKVNEIDRPG